MFDAGRRPMGRLFFLVLAMIAELAGLAALVNLLSLGGVVRAAAPMPQNGPASTTVSDTVYRADGTPAQGTLIITWPAFITASGAAVGGGKPGRDAGVEWCAERGAGSKCGRKSGERILHGGVSAERWNVDDGILAGADDVAGRFGAGADDSGIGDGGATGVDAVCEHGAGDEGE